MPTDTTDQVPGEPSKGGRPLKEIDLDQVRRLASIMCTMDEMAVVLKCSVDTLERRFAGVIKEGQMEGKMSLRRAQFAAAHGRAEKPAQYLLDADKKVQLDGKGRPIVVAPFQEMVKANVTAQIWLGKQYLEQTDKVQFGKGEGFDFGK